MANLFYDEKLWRRRHLLFVIHLSRNECILLRIELEYHKDSINRSIYHYHINFVIYISSFQRIQYTYADNNSMASSSGNDNTNEFSLPKVRLLEGISDYPYWRRNAWAYLIRQYPLLLGLKSESAGNYTAPRTAWEWANALAQRRSILMLSEYVQVWAIALFDDTTNTAFDLWEFLESTHTASNEQVIQNIRYKLDYLIYTYWTVFVEQLNKFNSLIARLFLLESCYR